MSEAILTSSPLIVATLIAILVSVHGFCRLTQRDRDERAAQFRLLYTAMARVPDDATPR